MPSLCRLSRVFLLAPLALTGCALNSITLPTTVTPAAIHGQVHGGQQPISGSQVYLLAANTTGYGKASVSLLTSGDGSTALGNFVLSHSDGSFSISNQYTCMPNQQVYLYVLGGDPGSGPNIDSGLLAILGSCPAAQNFAAATPYVTVNELTTVAAAYAFAGYATDATHVSSSGTTLAQTGIANAFATAGNLVALASGTALATTPGSTTGNVGTVPQTELNSLADILAYCVNSNPTTTSNCSTLFGYAMNGSTTPTDTATAALNIAHNPAANVTNLLDLPSGLSPFQPTESPAPGDLTLTIIYTAGVNNYPQDLAIDAAGNVWYTWYAVHSSGQVGVNELSPLGIALSGTAGYTSASLPGPLGIAIDNAGDAWVTNGSNGSGAVTELSSTGSVLGSYAAGYSAAIAIDGSGNVWIPSCATNKTCEFSGATGTAVGSSPFTGGNQNGPVAVAIDGSGNAWIPDQNGSMITEISSTGAATSYANSGVVGNFDVAIDASGNVWSANTFSNSLTKLSNNGGTSTSYTGGGLHTPENIAIDGTGNVWITNGGSENICAFSNSGAALSSTGFSSGISPQDIAVDGSGNVWVTNAYPAYTVLEFVGAASPVVTPLAAGVKANMLGTRP